MSKFWSGVAATLSVLLNLIAAIGEIKTTSAISVTEGRLILWIGSVVLLIIAGAFWGIEQND
jgi:hypothetical protein